MKYSEIDEEVKKSLKRDWIITNGAKVHWDVTLENIMDY